MIGALAAKRFNRPYLLSEHGIYVRERVKDLIQREWTPKDSEDIRTPTHPGVGPHTRLWMDFFFTYWENRLRLSRPYRLAVSAE